MMRLVEMIEEALSEIREVEKEELSDFALGQVYAYMDCLEVLKSDAKTCQAASILEKLFFV